MGYFAKIENNVVTQVIAAEQDFIDSGFVGDPADWKQTSYNTRGGVHYAPNSNTPDGGIALRGNYAGVGYTYDPANDVFYQPKPYPTWTIAAPAWTWTPPVAYPTDGKIYTWTESTLTWDLAPIQPA